MDESIKLSIKARRDAFESTYELNDSCRKEIDELFKKIEEFGLTCSTAMEFENKFLSSSLNQEYTDMFVKVSQKCKVKNIENLSMADEDDGTNPEQRTKEILDELGRPARRAAYAKLDSKLRDTPFGKAEQMYNTACVFNKIKGKFKKNKNEENN